MKKPLMWYSALALTALGLTVGMFVLVQGQKKNQIALTSDVQKVSIISQRHDAAKGVLGEAVYQLTNEADVPIVAITFETDDRKSHFYRLATIAPDRQRQIVALANSMFEIRVPLDEGISYNHIVAVVYADGSVSGREDAAKYLKQIWEEAYKEAAGRPQ